MITLSTFSFILIRLESQFIKYDDSDNESATTSFVICVCLETKLTLDFMSLRTKSEISILFFKKNMTVNLRLLRKSLFFESHESINCQHDMFFLCNVIKKRDNFVYLF